MLAKIQSFYGFTKIPFGRDIAPGQLHRHHGHAEAVAQLTWVITTRSLAELTGEGQRCREPLAFNIPDDLRHMG